MHHSELAQLVEHTTVNRAVVGSSPTFGVIADLAQLVEQRYRKPWVTGSTPAISMIKRS